MARALSVDNIVKINHDVFDFEGEWEAFVNKPERCGVWFVYATSASGKSSFVMQLAKYLTRFGNVLYNSREEGTSKSFKDRLIRFNMHEVKGRFRVVNEDRPELEKRLDRQRSPEILIIDSKKYFKMNFKEYLAFKKKYSKKTIIIIGHAKGNKPSTIVEEDISFDAYIKIWIEGYVAFSKGREIGSKGSFTIWDEGANKIWGESSGNNKKK
jgi:hypothetical protein